MRKKMSQNSETGTRAVTHNMHFEITLAQGESDRAIKQLTHVDCLTQSCYLEERQISKQIHSLINIA